MQTSAKPYTHCVTVEVLIFGAAAAAIKADRVPVTVPNDASAQHVLDALATQHPTLRAALQGARLAVNQSFAKADTAIKAGDEVALISLVGGG